MSEPLVSIVSLLYDTKTEYVNACIDSLLNQTYQNIEIIFVDDCSPNIDYSYITELSPKIKLFRNEKNLGFNRNSQKSFELAAGKYVVKIDSDDYVDSTLIEKEVNFLENNSDYGAVCCELQRFGIKEQHIKRPKVWDIEVPLSGRISGYGYEGGMMFRTSLLKEVAIDPNLPVCTDLDLHLQILERTKIQSIHEILYYYRSHDGNIMNDVHKSGKWKGIVNTIIHKHQKLYEQTLSYHATQKNSITNVDNMDFVYLVKPGYNSEELYYSLRTIAKHYPNNKVWLVGCKPEGIINVNYLPIKEKNEKWKNLVNDLIEACKCDEISDDFIYMNDDFFAICPTIPLAQIIESHIGSLDKPIERYENTKRKLNGWHRAFKSVDKLMKEMGISEPYYNYEAHTPLRINKQKFLEVMQKPEVQKFLETENVLHYRSLYKNYDKPKNKVYLPQDVKLLGRRDQTMHKIQTCGWLSTADNIINNPNFSCFNKLLNNNFNKPCKYEEPNNSLSVICNAPKISVVMPLYNVEKYLRQSLDSVIDQTYKNLEIICVNDASTDNTLSILEEYAEKDKRIKIITNEKNLHCGISRNVGMKHATGDYLIILDGDDFFHPKMLELMCDKIRKDNSDVVVCEFFVFDEITKKFTRRDGVKDKIMRRKALFGPMDFKDILFYEIKPNTWTKLFKRSFLLENNLYFDDNVCCTDVSCIYTAMVCAKKISLLNEPLVFYRENQNDNLSAKRYNHLESQFRALSILENNLKEKGLFEAYKKSFMKRAKITIEYNHCPEKSDLEKQLAKDILPPETYNYLYENKNPQ